MSGGEQQMHALGVSGEHPLARQALLGLSVQLCPLQLCRELFQTLARIKGPGARRALGGEKVRQSLAIAITATSWRRSRSVGEGSAAQRKSAPSLQRIYLGGAVCPA